MQSKLAVGKKVIPGSILGFGGDYDYSPCAEVGSPEKDDFPENRSCSKKLDLSALVSPKYAMFNA